VADVGRHGGEVVAVGRVLDAALRRMAIVPDAVAGHSVGEWTAMVTGGLFAGRAVDEFVADFDPDEVRVPGLAFAVLGAPADRVAAALADRPEIVLSHDNAPDQAMVCGPPGPVDELVRWFRGHNVVGQVLPFQSGFHTPMLAPYLDPIRRAASQFALYPPTVPVWSATTASVYPPTEAEVRELFLRHLLEPVRFRPLIEAMYAAGVRVFVQAGTGQVGALIDNTLHGRPHLAVAANSPHRSGLAQLHRVATALWAEGGAPDFRPLRAVRGAASKRAPVRLDLGGPLVSFDAETLGSLRSALAARPAVRTGGDLSALEAAAGRLPVAGELSALLKDTAETATAVLSAARSTARRGAPPAAPAPATAPPAPPAPGGRESRTVLRVSTDTMPYLLDHCFFAQRPGWPDEADRWPVVPATTVIHHMMECAERAQPGTSAVAVHGVQLNRWVTASPAADVPVTVAPQGPGRVGVTFGQFARAEVELAAGHLAAPPRPWTWDPASERPPKITAEELYEDRWMFHGPLFQGVTELTAVGPRHVRGQLTTPPAPGALLDNVGQLLGYWIISTLTERTVVFPVRMRRMRFFGPHPATGATLDCLVRITSVTETAVEADIQLVADGRVWAQIHGWQDRRFDNREETRVQERFPERNTLSRVQQGGWSLVHDRWPDLASRDLVMRNHLSSAEREDYERRPPRGRAQWLLGRIAVKDAVRRWLWDHGEGPVFPAEIRVSNDEAGRPRVAGLHGRTLPELDVTLAHCAETGVAMVHPRTGAGPSGIGIDVEEVTERPEPAQEMALGPAERELLAAQQAETGEPEGLWFTRFWAAKEAVAKARGTGLQGRPKDFAVVAAQPEELLVEATGRLYRVWCRRIANPADLASREYVVAWTTESTETMDERETTR